MEVRKKWLGIWSGHSGLSKGRVSSSFSRVFDEVRRGGSCSHKRGRLGDGNATSPVGCSLQKSGSILSRSAVCMMPRIQLCVCVAYNVELKATGFHIGPLFLDF
ncbi:hypothetical protein KC19_5G029300 [Ceratodon purpureus]|uniref:Uncharacterized protein n=1 Tax=Ceratodon purpureus TaxID=3225 RepID=A0A8T0HXE4_CERPU|nr:hypothetical protein KC19_5G029300 [Ceratodon purpureus]